MNGNTQETIRVAFYIRVSTKEQVEKYGIELQEEALRSLLKSRLGDERGRGRMVLAGEGREYIYIDDDISGGTPIAERPGFSKLMEDLSYSEQKPFDIVAVYKIDRFARKLKVLLDIIDFFDEREIGFISVHESIDTSTPFGRAMLGVIGVIAELERETIRERTSSGIKAAFNDGVVLGMNAPYGYRKNEEKKHKILPEEAEIVRLIFELFVQDGKSLDYIAKYLTSQETPSPETSSFIYKKRKGESKKKESIMFWRAERIGHILRDPIYVGDYYSNKRKGGKAMPKEQWILSSEPVPSIIDRVTFEKAQRLLLSNQHIKRDAKDGHVYLLRGLLKCDCCYNSENSTDVRITWHGERKVLRDEVQYYYKCGKKNTSKTTKVCSSLPINATELEEYIIKFSSQLLSNPIAVFNHQNELKSQKQTEKNMSAKENRLIDLIKAIPKRKERLLEQNESGLIDLPTLKRKAKELDEKLKEYNKQREELMREKAQTTISKGYIQAINIFSQKYSQSLTDSFKDREKLATILHQLIEEIVVYGRPVKPEDSIAGIKRKGQIMPDRIHIKLRLPQDMMSELLKSSGLTATTSAR